MRKLIITAALIYANGFPHLGHIASTYLPADIFARFMKLWKGNKNVVFVCATDEHGTPIQVSAEECGKDTQNYVEVYRKEDLKDLESVGIKFDIFYHTHSHENEELTKEFFEKAKKHSLIYEQEIESLYCESCKRFLPDRYVIGTCPFCGAENQYGDICENCGKTYNPVELKSPKCKVCGSIPIIKKTKHYFFRLSALTDKIKEYLENNEELQEDAKNYALQWIKEGLKDLDITRDNPYFGFKIPGHKNKYFYVWIDAPLGYISSSLAFNKMLRKWWEQRDTKIVHFIGKDIVYFHYIYWIAMLLTMGFVLPFKMPTRGYLTINKNKMSKSKGNFLLVRDVMANLPSPDYLRFYFARVIPDHIADGDFSVKGLIEKSNKELIGNIVNVAYRVLSMLKKKGGGKPRVLKFHEEVIDKYINAMKEARIKEALEILLNYSSEINAELNAKEPWKKEDKEATEILEELINKVIILYGLLEPFIPTTVNKFYKMAGVKRVGFNEFEFKGVQKVEHLLERLDEKALENLKGTSIINKVDLRVGTIKEVMNIEGSEKLYLIKLNDGEKTRQLIAGLRKYYTYEELVGKKVVFVANLKPAKIFGYLSEGMLLVVSSDNNVGLVEVHEEVKDGSDVIIKGVIKKPSKELDIKEFRKIDLVKQGKNLFYNNRKVVVRNKCGEYPVVIDRFESIKDGAKAW